MPTHPNHQTAAVLRAWALPAVAAATVAAGIWSYTRSGEVHAAPGSPYYDKAVKEAISGLVNPGAAAAPAAQPALPAGLNAADYYWCDQCKAYHKREAAAGQAQPAATPGGTPPPGPHPEPEPPPLLAGLAPADFVWCVQCQAFHRRADPAAPPAAATPVPAGAAPGTETIPPLPAGLSPADYYWCPNCKVYHQRQPAAGAQPGTPPPTPATPPVTPPPTAPPAPATPPAPPPAGTPPTSP